MKKWGNIGLCWGGVILELSWAIWGLGSSQVQGFGLRFSACCSRGLGYRVSDPHPEMKKTKHPMTAYIYQTRNSFKRNDRMCAGHGHFSRYAFCGIRYNLGGAYCRGSQEGRMI